ncbi:Nucleotide-binding universal stress protein, UspA family [Streptomyces sp. TLI_053]|uniref:universal stress protein n=1 Tax=Streptomyces sp. TLI_053 TaxID=1855352 RepID=UPI00087A04FE|nr:universal stress protein [Streptomyces sp. TLI_053]SDT82342.1 Nucleotide-binding universal stress protein, UspA family [Streptomyces sp. TLI_053]
MSGFVVVGVDGSPESLAALDWAAEEAAGRGAVLRVVLAWPSVVTPLSVLGAVDLAHRQAEVTLREAELRVRERWPELAVTAVQVPHDPVRALVEEAGEAATLVLGSRGLGAVAGFLVGSVGQRVLARSDVPVVLVREGRTEGGEVVVGVDPYEGPDAVLGQAFAAAERRGLPLRAVYAWTLPVSYQYAGIAASVDVSGAMQTFAETELARVVQPWRAEHPGVTVVEEVLNARPAKVLAERAAAGAELVVVGRRVRRSPLGAHLGSVAHAVLHHVPCPVAVVPYERTQERTPDETQEAGDE